MKKIFAIFALLALAVTITAVSALGDLTGGDNQTVQIDEIDFNVPEGFKPDTSQDLVNSSQSAGGVDYIVNSKTFECNTTQVVILVADYSPQKVTDEIISAVGENRTTINGIDGYLSFDDGFYNFNYEKNDRLVVITSNDEDVIGDFLIA